ncbi:MAG: autotransporter outer membrane beta-barrel domain-containing protein [Solidesulfovibrio sp.]
MKQMRPTFIIVLFLTITTLFTPTTALAARFNQFVGFGDSTFDSGYFRYNTTGISAYDRTIAAAVANGASGGFVGPGIMNSTMLANMFGLSGAAIGGGGFNYANGGAFTAPLRVSDSDPYISGVSAPTNVSTLTQIQNYLASVGGMANPDALYMIKTSDNDLQFLRFMTPAWVAANPNFLQNLANAEATTVAALQAAGARTIMVPNSYNYAVFAGLGGNIAPGNEALYATSKSYGTMRWTSLAAAGVRFIPADIDSLFRFVVQHPTLFGFTPTSVLSANALYQSLSPLLISWLDVTPEQLQSYLFIGANGVHLTTAGQQIEADYEYSLLVAPTQISLLAESAIQNGLARMATIQGQIDLSGQHRGPTGINFWTTVGGSSQNFTTETGFPDTSGGRFFGSAGADYLTPCGLIVGAAFTAGKQTQDFSPNGGHYDQVEEVLSLYTAYKAGPFWGNVVASYGLNQNEIRRQVVLGRFLDQNSADTNGQSLALALRAGGDIKLGPLTTGPVGGLVVQQVRIKGFTETGTSGVTALTFGGQTRDSVVSQLGWRVLLDIGDWQPFAEAKWNHECVEQKRMVRASLTTVSAPTYSVEAAPAPTDWTTASIGSSYKLNERVMLRGVASAVLSNPQVVKSYGGELGISVNF